MRWLDGIIDSMHMSLRKLRELVMDREVWRAAVHRVASLSPEDPLEEKIATHSSILAWRILWTEAPRGLQLKGLQRVRHD